MSPGRASPTDPSAFAPARWWRIIPVVFVTYSLAYLDRANFGLAAAAGMARDLGITESMSALIGSLFLFGYFVFQIPLVVYAQRSSVKKLIFFSLLLWGGCAVLTGVLRDPRGLLLIRFLLGVAEAAVFPAMLIYVSRWFTGRERARANTLLTLGNPVTVLWMSVISGYLIQAYDWRWMFILEGAPTLVWAFLWWFLACERPADSSWLSAADKAGLSERLAAEQTALGVVKNLGVAFRSRTVIVLSLHFFFWTMGFYGFVLWLPSILKAGSALGIVAVGWLSSAPYLLAIVLMPVVSHFSDQTRRRQVFVWPFLLLSSVGFLASCLLGSSHFWLSFGLLVVAGACMYAPYGPFWAIVPELLPQNVTGGAIALINSMGAMGAFIGSYLVGYLKGVTGNPSASYMVMACALLCAVLLTFLIGTRNPAPAGRTALKSASLFT
jgi:MFS family permease